MTKKRKIAKKQLIISGFVDGNLNWRYPGDATADLTTDIEPWINLAQTLERGKVHTLFIADHLSLFDVYKGPGNFRDALVTAGFAPRVEPSIVASAIARETENIGIGLTFSTVSEHPYHFARRLASLDHITKGRVAWNIVSSYLPSIGRQLLNNEPFPEHDLRYKKTTEFLDVVSELLCSSWREDAVIRDSKAGIFAAPERIREINHVGDFFKVAGPPTTQPSPQRFPVIIQAGGSKKGQELAAEIAELIYIRGTSENVRRDVANIRKIAKEKFGRDPSHIKFLYGFQPIIGETHEEAAAKADKIREYKVPNQAEVLFGGLTGIDLSKYEGDQVIEKVDSSAGIKSLIDTLFKDNEDSKLKKGNIFQEAWNRDLFIGTAEKAVDYIEQLVEDLDIDGLNVRFYSTPSGAEDLVNLLIPELRKRGLFWNDYSVPGGSLRENIYGIKGQKFVTKDHSIYPLGWRKDIPLEEFEKDLSNYKLKRKVARESLD